MQTDAPQTSKAPTPAPNPANAPNPVFLVQGPSGTGPITLQAPRTARDIDALKARREELSNQLQSVDSRRSKLLTQLQRTSDATAVQGLEARLSLLDARQLQLESDIATTGQQLSSASAGIIGTTGQPVFYGGMSSRQVMALSVLSIIFVLFPLAAGLSRGIWKRSAKQGVPPAVLTETAQRLERLESSVDAIAIEIERISEGQRFVTKLLAEGQPMPMIGSPQRSPQAVGK